VTYEVDNALEMQRPFLGERLWTLFFLYRAFSGRLAFRVVDGKQKGALPVWDADAGITDLLKTTLSSAEIETARSPKFGGPQYAINLFEQKIIGEADRWISGKSAAELSIEEGQHLAEALRLAQNAVRKP